MRKPHTLMRLARKGWDHRDWYREVTPLLLSIASRYDTKASRVAGVLAVTSPRVNVTRNVRVTIQYLGTGTLPNDTIRSTHAALAHFEETGIIRGPKTSAFARALQGDEEAIVIDTWMCDALGVEWRATRRKAVRASINRRIRYCAHVMGLTPAQFQAACWAGTYLSAGPKHNVPRMDTIIKDSLCSSPLPMALA